MSRRGSSSKDNVQIFSWEDLPDELKLAVLVKLRIQDLLNMSRVNRQHANLLRDEPLWKSFLHNWQYWLNMGCSIIQKNVLTSYKNEFKAIYLTLTSFQRQKIENAISGKPEDIEFITIYALDDPNKLIMRAAENRLDINSIKLLFANGADPTLKNEEGCSAMSLAVFGDTQSSKEVLCIFKIVGFLKLLEKKKHSKPYKYKSFSPKDERLNMLKYAKQYDPEYFQEYIKEILNNDNTLPWVTDSMRAELLSYDLVREIFDGEEAYVELTEKFRDKLLSLKKPSRCTVS